MGSFIESGRKPKLPRRLILQGTLAAGTAMLVGCGDQAKTSKTQTPTKELEILTFGKDKALLTTEINRLPDSSIKSLLQQRVSPIFSPTPPLAMSYGDFQFPIRGSDVEITYSESAQLSGQLLQQFYEYNPPAYKSTFDVRLVVPVVGNIIKESEKNQFPQTADDGTPFFNFSITPDSPMFEGMGPKILITRPRRGVSSPAAEKFTDEFTKFLLIKESCTNLLTGIVAEEMHKEMQKYSVPTKIDASAKDGTVHKIEAINMALDAVSRRNQRLQIAIDLGGAAIAIKATENTAMLNEILGDSNLAYLAGALKQVDLGSTAPEIMKNAFSHVLGLPNLEQVLLQSGIKGDITKFP